MKPKRLPSKFLVTQVSKEDRQLILELAETLVISGTTPPNYRCKLLQDWSSLDIRIGDFLNILDPQIEYESQEKNLIGFLVDNTSGLVVINPDVLVPITKLTEAIYCMRKAWLSRMFNIFGEPSLALLVGTIVHQIFQDSLLQKKYTINEIESIFIEEVINQYTLELYDLNMSREDLIAQVKPYISTIYYWIKLYMNPNIKSEALFTVKRLFDIENEIWSIKYGFIGKIDLSLEATFEEDGTNRSTRTNLIPVELKTGKHSFSNQHVAQIILYSFIMSERFVNSRSSGGYLVYLKDGPHTEHIKTNHNVFKDLVIQRNRFIRFFDKLGLIDENNREKLLLKGPETLNNYSCSRCDHRLDCSLIYRNFDIKLYEQNDSHLSMTETSHLKSSEMEFFAEMVSLLEIENQHCMANDEVVSFWNYRSEEREFYALGLSKLKIKHQDNKSIVFIRHPKIQSLSKVFFDTSNRQINASSIEERKVLISEEMLSSNITFQIYGNYCKQLCVSVGLNSSISSDMTEILITLAKDQINFLNPNAIYRIDFLKNFFTRASKINFSNLLRLMDSDDPKAAELREIVIHGRIPKINLNDCKISNFSQITNLPLIQNLNVQQKRCILGILKTKCSLIFGCPGSGKTQTIVALILVLVRLGYSVLVTSYTHAAVDNILGKLLKAKCEEKFYNNVDFLRIGSHEKITKESLLHYTDEYRTKKWLSTGDLSSLNNFYSTVPVVAATCLGVFKHPLFRKRTFDFCIIDEASQSLLATSLGPLFCSNNFVLVGDQKQLPPVVQSPYARKCGLDESLFARLLNRSGKENVNLYDDHSDTFDMESSPANKCKVNSVDLKSIRIFPLFIQYRMNSVIMKVANRLTYANRLKCGNKEVELITMADYLPSNHQTKFYEDYPLTYLCKIISPLLQDSVVVLDTDGIEQALEITVAEGLSEKNQNILSSSQPNKSMASYVYNDFEAQLIIQIIQNLLLVYRRGNFKTENIGVISPFRKQVSRISELFGSEFSEENKLEISTVDGYQGRDKDVIVYSCVKSSELSESGTSDMPIIDSELLKDERRLNVAMTRAKRKLIIVGNCGTLKRYLPFRNLFNVLDEHQFIRLSTHNYQNIVNHL